MTLDFSSLDGLLLPEPTLQLVRSGLSAGAQAHPGIDLDGAAIARLVSRLLARGADAAALCWEDLYLVEATLGASGGPAWARLKALHGYRLASVFRRTLADDSAADELLNQFWVELAVPLSGSTARLSRYGGRGALGAWLVVSAARYAQKAKTRTKEEVSSDDALLDRIGAAEEDLALKLFKTEHHQAFTEAVKQAFRRISLKDRNLLRHHYLDSVETGELARLFGVHRATAVRWIASAREAFVAAFRDELSARLSVQRLDVDSIARLFKSHLDISLPLEVADP
jgi:RNA polymerase sigma-70 factor (ECF subfamily)